MNDEEFRQIIFIMHPMKAPRVDGLHAIFYQSRGLHAIFLSISVVGGRSLCVQSWKGSLWR